MHANFAVPRVGVGILVLTMLPVALRADQSTPSPPSTTVDDARIDARIRALEEDADALARQARTLLGELRSLEIERDLRREQAARAETAAAAALARLRQNSRQVADLEQRRLTQAPEVSAHLVEIYKHGRYGYGRWLLGGADGTHIARLIRMTGALATIAEQRLTAHRRTLDELRTQRTQLEAEVQALRARDDEARLARQAAERAVTARAALMADIDQRRDATAQYVGELRAAAASLQRRIEGLRSDVSSAVPLAPRRGAISWPAAGTVASGFGGTDRVGGTATKNGIEVASPEGSQVVAIHEGTVGFAGEFAGYGRLVIVEHGNNVYSLYGYLGSTSVAAGDRVEPGTEVGRVGLAPAGPPALYFELRVDGQPTDPLQWLKPR